MSRKTISLRKLVSNKCRDCAYDPLDVGTWRYQVERCTVVGCPLWEARPIRVEAGKYWYARNEDVDDPREGVVE